MLWLRCLSFSFFSLSFFFFSLVGFVFRDDDELEMEGKGLVEGE